MSNKVIPWSGITDFTLNNKFLAQLSLKQIKLAAFLGNERTQHNPEFLKEVKLKQYFQLATSQLKFTLFTK